MVITDKSEDRISVVPVALDDARCDVDYYAQCLNSDFTPFRESTLLRS